MKKVVDRLAVMELEGANHDHVVGVFGLPLMAVQDGAGIHVDVACSCHPSMIGDGLVVD